MQDDGGEDGQGVMCGFVGSHAVPSLCELLIGMAVRNSLYSTRIQFLARRSNRCVANAEL